MSERKVRIGISGLGWFAPVLANAIRNSSRTELVTCFTRTPEKRTAFSQRHACGEDESFEAMVKRDDVDAVVLVTPNAVHREQTELAARHGKHVFVEKPIANTLEDGRRMIDACRQGGVVLMVAHVARRHAGNRMAKKLLESGALGKPMLVEANVSSDQGVGLVPEEFRWRADDLGCPAGPLMTMGVHHADTLNYLFGPVKSVFSVFTRRHIAAPVPDVTTTVLHFESGVLGYLGSTFASPRTNWLHIYGTEANLVRTWVDADRNAAPERRRSVDENTRLELIRAAGSPERVEFPIGDPMLEQIDEFADCIREGRKPETDGESSMRALAVIRAAIESAETGRPADVRTS
jgi:predicted dehydrogenase